MKLLPRFTSIHSCCLVGANKRARVGSWPRQKWRRSQIFATIDFFAHDVRTCGLLCPHESGAFCDLDRGRPATRQRPIVLLPRKSQPWASAMTFYAIAVLLVALILLTVLWHKRFGGYMPAPYRSRPCQGFAWKQHFPGSPDDEIRSFLRLFAQAFAYRDVQMLQVSPDDRLIDVYRAHHPKIGGVDGLELETFAAETEKKYKINCSVIWSEALTFGALFAACQDANVIKDTEHGI